MLARSGVATLLPDKRGTGDSEGDWRRADFDPMPYWLSVDQPVLVLCGARDEADNVPVSESVRRLHFVFDLVGKKNQKILTIPGAGHAFLNDDGRLMPEFVEALTSWIEVQTRSEGR